MHIAFLTHKVVDASIIPRLRDRTACSALGVLLSFNTNILAQHPQPSGPPRRRSSRGHAAQVALASTLSGSSRPRASSEFAKTRTAFGSLRRGRGPRLAPPRESPAVLVAVGHHWVSVQNSRRMKGDPLWRRRTNPRKRY